MRSNEIAQLSNAEIQQIKQQLIYRHISWLYVLREKLLASTQWEHVSLKHLLGKIVAKRRESGGVSLFKDYLNSTQQKNYFGNNTLLNSSANKATQIINQQSLQLADLQEKQILNMRRQLEMQKVLSDFYDHQCRAERIKKIPLPRQYANLSFVFNCIFIFIYLLLLGIVVEFAELGETGAWLMIPFGSIVGWIYVMMELIGDYSENPFEGLGTGVPMLSICRTIEIDLLQMLGETDIANSIQLTMYQCNIFY